MFDPKLTVDDERKRKIDRIRGYAEKFEEVSKDYNRLLYMVEEEKFLLRNDRASEAFLTFVEAAGAIVSDSLCQSATLTAKPQNNSGAARREVM